MLFLKGHRGQYASPLQRIGMTVCAIKKFGINPIRRDYGAIRKCHDLCPENARSVVMGKAPYRLGFDIETTWLWLFVSDKFPSWEMLGNFIEMSGTR